VTTSVRIRHAGVSLALHEHPAAGEGRLLLLHELGGSSADWGGDLAAWPGSAFALDFSGHGASAWRAGAAYTPELLAADADAALAAVGPCALAGAGLGAWVALLLAGARPDMVRATLLLPGRGLDGGGPLPDPSRAGALAALLDRVGAEPRGAFDPMALVCEADVRPPEYARAFAEAARRLLLAEDGGPHPPWWHEVRQVAATTAGERRAAFARLAEMRD